MQTKVFYKKIANNNISNKYLAANADQNACLTLGIVIKGNLNSRCGFSCFPALIQMCFFLFLCFCTSGWMIFSKSMFKNLEIRGTDIGIGNFFKIDV